MILSDAIGEIQRRIGWRSDLADRITTQLMEAQKRIERDPRILRPWWLVQEYSNAAFKTTASTRTVAVPANFLGEDEEAGDLYVYDVTDTEDPYHELTKDDAGHLRATQLGGGEPTHYALVGSNIELYPLPDAEYVLRWHAWFGDTVLTYAGDLANTNNWLTQSPFLLIGLAGETIAQLVSNAVAKEAFTAMYTDDIARHNAMVLERQLAGEGDVLMMGGDD